MTDLAATYPSDRITLREVGLRDGLQLTGSFPSTAAKREWVAREAAAGITHFEAGSCLPAARFPQFADVGAVVGAVQDAGGHAIVLALNPRGLEDALAGGADEITLVLSASEAHNLANVRRSREQGLAEIADAVARRDAHAAASGRRPLLNVGLAMAFGCSLSGAVEPAEVLRLAEACLAAGVDLVGVADTVGFAGPRQVTDMCRAMTALCGDRPYVVHLHDTRGLGLANAAAAVAAGARILDASLGGLGGCPFAPGATGNIVMEDTAYLLEGMGVATGVDLDALIAIRDILSRTMPDEPLHGRLARAGQPAFDWRARPAA